MTDQRKKYLLEAYREIKVAEKGVEGMSATQFDAILQAIDAIQEAMSYANECHDLRLSDVDKLMRAQYKLERSINTEPNDYQIEGWKEYGIGQDDDDDEDTADE
jgi:hypothetical protein